MRIKKVEDKIFIDDDTSSDKEKASVRISNLYPAGPTSKTRSQVQTFKLIQAYDVMLLLIYHICQR